MADSPTLPFYDIERDDEFLLPLLDYCPCLLGKFEDGVGRYLAEEKKPDPPLWQAIVVTITLAIMFGFMLMDYIGPDWVMIAGLTVFMVTEIVTIKQGLEGFANEGIMTVMALFVVAEAISRTGALDYYLGMIMGKPTTLAGAQIRLMIPIAILSTFLNNTPIVAVMIPLVLRWGKSIGAPRQQLLIPLSYATILGGTCSLVGTSTNLVVSGLLSKDYPTERAGNMGLFDVGLYGVPNAIIGISYILVFSPFLLPYGRASTSVGTEDILLGARVTPWSPAAGRTILRSGLVESGGVYLVHVRRATTGNIHHSVNEDFVLSVGDALYFTGSVTEFSDFCKKHCLEIITTGYNSNEQIIMEESTDNELGSTKDSIVQSEEAERLKFINHLSDQIQERQQLSPSTGVTRIVPTADAFHSKGALIVGVDCFDRPDLLVDISQGLLHLHFDVRHSEAKVFNDRSLSVWRCQSMDSSLPNLGDIWVTLSSVLSSADKYTTTKKSGAQVVRAIVTNKSRLIGKLPMSVHLRETYKAGIVAYQKDGKNTRHDVPLDAGDVLVLEVAENSPLLTKPPDMFYENSIRSSRVFRIQESDIENRNENSDVWNDLQVLFDENDKNQAHASLVPNGEFLTAFTIPKGSPIIGKSLNQVGYSRLPGVVLVSVERPSKVKDVSHSKADKKADYVSGNDRSNDVRGLTADDELLEGDILWYTGSAYAIGDLQKVNGLVFFQNDEIQQTIPILQNRRLIQAVIARGSPLIGKSLKDSRFRARFGGVVLAVQRGSSRVHQHPGDVVIQVGDVLLIDASTDFLARFEHDSKVFALVAEVENSSPPRPRLFLLCVILIISSLLVASLDYRSLLITATLCGIVMVSCGVVTQQEARDALDWDLYVVVGAAFGVANAMTNSGVAKKAATGLVNAGLALNIGDAGVYGAVYLAGNILSAILTNNAAAALTYPIAMEAVKQTGTDRWKMGIILMLSASDYITSFGYQTNLMVYGPGGYSNMDYLRFGSPMQIALWLSSTALVSSDPDKWYISWLFCFIGLAVVCVFRLMNVDKYLKARRRSTTVSRGEDDDDLLEM